MSSRIRPLLIIMSLAIVSGCVVDHEPELRPSGKVDGYVPVYGDPSRALIRVLEPSEIHQPGKIYRYGPYLLINEKRKGIHVFDISDPAQPQPMAFVEILGNTDMAVRDNILYVDHVGQLVALEVVDFATVLEKGRLPLNGWEHGVPAPSGYYFECIDPTKGLVVSWKRAELINPNCYAY